MTAAAYYAPGQRLNERINAAWNGTPGAVNSRRVELPCRQRQAALAELRSVVDEIKQQQGIRGLILTSAKDSFILGADITEFLHTFAESREVIIGYLKQAHDILRDIEELPVPSVTAIQGEALGGGLEVALSTDYRVMTETARIGLPETKLGIIPGFGGSIRLPRLIGPENALEWIASGEHQNADKALAVGAADSLVDPSQLQAACLHIIAQCNSGKLDWKARRARKSGALKLGKVEATCRDGVSDHHRGHDGL